MSKGPLGAAVPGGYRPGWKIGIGGKMKILLLIAIGAIALVSCGDGGGGDPAVTVEKYMEAKVAGDAEAIRSLLCSEMEVHLERESRTFESVSGVQLEEMACQQEGESTTVRCQGRIVALYGTEQTEFPLVSYRVVEEDGEWKWCGEAP